MNAKLSYGPPQFQTDEDGFLGLAISSSEPNRHHDVLMANTRFDVRERRIQGSLLIVFYVGSVQVMINALETLVA